MQIFRRLSDSISSYEFTLISHRGGKGFGPENTLESLSNALDYGVEMIETDVRMSKDGVPIIHHSPFLGIQLLSHLNLEEIMQKAPKIPTLKDYLDLAGKRCALNLEIKKCQPHILAELIKRASLNYPILVSSFDSDFLKEFGKLECPAECGLVTQYNPITERLLEEAIQCGATTLLSVSYSISENFVNAAHKVGLRLFAWTVNTTVQLQNMIQAGVDGVVTDSYKELKEWMLSQMPFGAGAETAVLDDGSLPL